MARYRKSHHPRLGLYGKRRGKRPVVHERPEVRLTFLLPDMLAGALAPGTHGYGVQVLPGDTVVANAWNWERCIVLARDFLAAIAQDRPDFCMAGTLTDTRKPGWCGTYLLSYSAGALTARCRRKPKLELPAA